MYYFKTMFNVSVSLWHEALREMASDITGTFMEQ